MNLIWTEVNMFSLHLDLHNYSYPTKPHSIIAKYLVCVFM